MPFVAAAAEQVAKTRSSRSRRRNSERGHDSAESPTNTAANGNTDEHRMVLKLHSSLLRLTTEVSDGSHFG
jgi:hypothetical protein